MQGSCAERSIRNAIIHRSSLIDVDFCWQCCNARHSRSFPSFPFTRDVRPQCGTGAYRRIFCAGTNRETLLLLHRKFEHNVAIEREFRAHSTNSDKSCIPLGDFILWPGSPIPRDRRFRSRASKTVWKRFHGWNRKKTRVTRISTNFDHGGPSLVYPNAEIIPSVIPGYILFLFSQLARVFLCKFTDCHGSELIGLKYE